MSGQSRRGFTVIEILIVMTIISILVSIAVPIYQHSIIRAKESVLKNNLFTLRLQIDAYTADKKKAPQSLRASGSTSFPASLNRFAVSSRNRSDHCRHISISSEVILKPFSIPIIKLIPEQ